MSLKTTVLGFFDSLYSNRYLLTAVSGIGSEQYLKLYLIIASHNILSPHPIIASVWKPSGSVPESMASISRKRRCVLAKRVTERCRDEFSREIEEAHKALRDSQCRPVSSDESNLKSLRTHIIHSLTYAI